MLNPGTVVEWPNGSRAVIKSISDGSSYFAKGYFVRDEETQMNMFMPESAAKPVMDFDTDEDGQLKMKI